ncbi:MAG TPA: dUTP diphosphatase [Ignavibacteria bacterium]|jgi:dUTP pyrophosphatase
MKIKIRKIDKTIECKLPAYATRHASGLDLSSASREDIVMEPMETVLIPTNFIIEIPPGYEGQVRPRSGLALKHNIGIINSPGTIDADYRGELKILLTNFGKEQFVVKFGDRIAQLVICKVERAELEIDDNISDTERSSGGFGHTGI